MEDKWWGRWHLIVLGCRGHGGARRLALVGSLGRWSQLLPKNSDDTHTRSGAGGIHWMLSAGDFLCKTTKHPYHHEQKIVTPRDRACLCDIIHPEKRRALPVCASPAFRAWHNKRTRKVANGITPIGPNKINTRQALIPEVSRSPSFEPIRHLNHVACTLTKADPADSNDTCEPHGTPIPSKVSRRVPGSYVWTRGSNS